MARKTKEELNDICRKLNIDTLWSWSRYHCYKQDKYEYFLKYVKHIPEDRDPSIYSVSGGYIHDIIEKLYNNKISYEDMLNEYENSLFVMNCSDLKYNRSDSSKNESIASKYENCMRHFFENHNQIDLPHKTEQFILIKISDDIYMQGYIDMVCYDLNNDPIIIDWKSSTRYQGQKIEKEAGQLLLYSYGVSQIKKIPLKNISCKWNFLKYVTVTIEQKNGKKKDRYIERNSIGDNLVNTARMWLKTFGHEDQIEDYIDKMVTENSIEYLPKEVQEKFEIKDCYVDVPLSNERVQELIEDIITTIHEIRMKEEEYKKTGDDHIFWQEITQNDEFRMATICGYSRKYHKPYDEYLKEKELFIEEDEQNNEENDLLDFINQL